MGFLNYFEIPAEIRENQLIRQILLPFRVLGLVVYTNDKHKLLHLLRGLLVIASFFFGTVLHFYGILRSPSYDINKITIPVSSLIVYLSLNCQFFMIIIYPKDFFNLVSLLANYLNSLKSSKGNEEKQLYKNFAFLSNFVFRFFVGCVVGECIVIHSGYFAAIIWNPAILQSDFVLDYEDTPFLLLFFNYKNFTNNFTFIYIFPVVAMWLYGIGYAAWSIVAINLLLFPIYGLKYLQQKLESLGNVPSSRLSEEMISLIRAQIELKNFIEKICSFISILIFIDFILFTICICLLLYYFAESNFERNSSTIIMIIFFIVVSLTQLCYHAIATEICHQWSLLSTAFYLSTWYNFPLPVKKMGLLMMIYSTRPIEMRAVFIQMHLSTFLSIMQGAYGYFTMLRNINPD